MKYLLPLLIIIGSIFGEQLIVENVTITGNSKTQDYVILGYFDLKKGDSFDTDKIAEYTDKINKTKLFSSVSIDYDKVDRFANVNITVVENWYLFPLPYASFHNNGFEDISYGGIGIYRNFLGLDHDIILLSSWGYRAYTAFKYNGNYFKNSRWKGFLSVNIGDQVIKTTDADDEIEDFPEYYNSNMIELKPIYQSKHYGDFGSLLSWEKRSFNSYFGDEKNNYFKLGLFHRYDNYDIKNYPTKGFYVETSLDYNGLDIEDDTNYSEFKIQLNTVVPLFKFTYDKPAVLALSLRHHQLDGSDINRQDNIYLNFEQLIRGFKPIIDDQSFSLISTAFRFRALETDPLRLVPFLPRDHKLNSVRLLVSTELFIENSFLDNSIGNYSFDNIITTAGSSIYIENPFAAGNIRFDFGYYLGSSDKFINKDKFRFSFAFVKNM